MSQSTPSLHDNKEKKKQNQWGNKWGQNKKNEKTVPIPLDLDCGKE
jgi:hypothetical protein